MLEWTGERFLPWINESTLAYEHLHRYAYAATLVKDKRVLDLASGEGYGTNMLAAGAAAVVGVDIDENVIRHASNKYVRDNIQFVSGSITSTPIRDDHSFDVIVCFEAIEHVEDQDALFVEVKRLLRPDGLFIGSTPNKTVYRHESAEENPFHVRELDFQEFKDLVARYFHNARYLGQRTHPGSSIWPIVADRSNGFQEFMVERGASAFEFISADKRVPLYFIVIASDSADALPQPASLLLDQSDRLIAEKDAQVQASAKEAQWREQQVADRDQTIKSRDETIQSLEEAVRWRESQIQDLAKGLEWTKERASSLEGTVASHEEALAWRAAQVNALETSKDYWQSQSETTTAQLQNTQRQLAAANDALTTIHASPGWKLFLKLRAIRDRLKGTKSRS
jgi:SAM-dependent methyltransferase